MREGLDQTDGTAHAETVEAERSSVEIGTARDVILGEIRPLGAESVGLGEARGRVLAETVVADRAVPPLDNSGMDGYAVRSEDVRLLPATLKVVAELPAGARTNRRLAAGEAARILTGAALLEGADAVVMQEHTERDAGTVTILRSPKPGENVRRAGSDLLPGASVALPGALLRPAHLGVFAALGRTQVRVVARPRVAILATGDELVEPDRLCDDGRIASSNSYALKAAVAEIGAEPVYLGIAPDRPEEIRAAFERALDCDVVVSTGGVSVGDRDWIKQVLADLGGTLRLWRVKMKPGAPLAFVMLRGRPVFGLPGNPVSTLVTFEQFVRPALLRMMGHEKVFRPVERAVLATDYEKPAGRAHFVRVGLELRDGERFALPCPDQSSAVLSSMVQADGLAFVPADETRVLAGTEVRVQMLERNDLRSDPGL